jgi:excisionase family DNA binding protein
MSPTHRTALPDPDDTLKLLSVAEVVELTGLTLDRVRKLVYCRQLPTVRIGPKRVYVRKSDLIEWLNGNTTPAREG